MGNFVSGSNLNEELKQSYLRPGITEAELERIYTAYQNLLIDGKNEIISKHRLRMSNYLSIVEKEAIISQKIKVYNEHYQEYCQEQNMINSQEGNIILNSEQQQQEFAAVIQLDQEVQQYEEDENNQDPRICKPQKQIDPTGIIKFESSRDINSNYICSCTNPSQKDPDQVSLKFEDFFQLMSAKIAQQKRSSSLNTVFESKAESVSCILWPSLSRGNKSDKTEIKDKFEQLKKQEGYENLQKADIEQQFSESQKNEELSQMNDGQDNLIYNKELINQNDEEAPQLVQVLDDNINHASKGSSEKIIIENRGRSEDQMNEDYQRRENMHNQEDNNDHIEVEQHLLNNEECLQE